MTIFKLSEEINGNKLLSKIHEKFVEGYYSNSKFGLTDSMLIKMYTNCPGLYRIDYTTSIFETLLCPESQNQ